MSNRAPNGDDNNLINFIAATVETMRDQMVEMRDQMVEMRDQMVEMRGEMGMMKGEMATKSDLARLEAKMVAETTAIRGDIEQVQLRLDSIDRTLRARLDHIETEVSRLRSVVYLLVKDKPDMLRLLGQSPPPDGENRL
ncbi:MAG: hypothetical protein ACRD68_18665 [Pyrinomonadaceae bacterium]